MVPATRIYLNELRPALEDSRAAAAAAARVGHHRAELIAHGAACVASRMLGDMSSAREHIERRAPLIQRLGARRFEAVRLRDAAALSETKGRPSEAVELLHRGVAISRETGIRFLGPWLLGQLAATTDDPEVRQQALDEGESLLHAGAVGHNHLWFYHFAIEATLSSRAWASVERYAAMLEDFTRLEPLPWSDFFIARGRALAAFGRGRRDAALAAELERLRSDADRVGLRIALPALEAALASATLGGSRNGAGLPAGPERRHPSGSTRTTGCPQPMATSAPAPNLKTNPRGQRSLRTQTHCCGLIPLISRSTANSASIRSTASNCRWRATGRFGYRVQSIANGRTFSARSPGHILGHDKTPGVRSPHYRGCPPSRSGEVAEI